MALIHSKHQRLLHVLSWLMLAFLISTITSCGKNKKKKGGDTGNDEYPTNPTVTGIVSGQQIDPNDVGSQYRPLVVEPDVPDASPEIPSRRIWFNRGVTVAIFDDGVTKIDGFQGWVISQLPARVKSVSRQLKAEIVDKTVSDE